MTNDVLEHLKAIKKQLNDFKLIVDEFKADNKKQADTIVELKDTVNAHSRQIEELQIEVQILKDGGNI